MQTNHMGHVWMHSGKLRIRGITWDEVQGSPKEIGRCQRVLKSSAKGLTCHVEFLEDFWKEFLKEKYWQTFMGKLSMRQCLG